MNTQQAKRIPLQDLLTDLGHQPVKEVRGELWYCSPFRPETVPSFKVNLERNVWYDFGEGAGGNVLDLVMRFHQTPSLTEALAHLEAFDQPRRAGRVSTAAPPVHVSDPHPSPPPASSPAHEARVTPLEHRALITYLTGRGIPRERAFQYLEEIHYSRAGKTYFALAFRNDSGGYELRNAYFKGTHGLKDLTLLPGEDTPPQTIAVFEGVIDALSAMTLGIVSDPLPSLVVLNSTALKDKALGAIQRLAPARVELYLDHDPSGRALSVWFQQQLTGIEVMDRSDLYAEHKDVNDALTAQCRQQD